MNRDWLTLAFGIGLVTAVVGLSVRQNVQWAASATAKPEADNATAATAAAPAPAVSDTAAAPAVSTVATESTPAGPGRADTPVPPADERRARFDVSVPVVHKHRFGSCEGTLRATNDLLVFGSPNKDDSFQLSFRDVDRFDMAAATLTVRRRGGRTWNFSGQNDRADPLVAFHRAVERARR